MDLIWCRRLSSRPFWACGLEKVFKAQVDKDWHLCFVVNCASTDVEAKEQALWNLQFCFCILCWYQVCTHIYNIKIILMQRFLYYLLVVSTANFWKNYGTYMSTNYNTYSKYIYESDWLVTRLYGFQARQFLYMCIRCLQSGTWKLVPPKLGLSIFICQTPSCI